MRDYIDFKLIFQSKMMLKFCIRLLWVLFTLSCVDSQDDDHVPVEVITASSPCSATCGLGLKTQTLCLLKDSKAAMEENTQGTAGPEVTQECRERKVTCLDSWQCGLWTLTVTVGEKLIIDCVEEVMKEMGPYAWRVSWRYARGVISSDDSLFTRWKAPDLDRLLLDPVEEKHAGTYRCDVQDAGSRRVKRIYWGVRVLPPGVINLDMRHSKDKHGKGRDHLDQTHQDLDMFMIMLFPFLMVVLALLVLLTIKRHRIRATCANWAKRFSRQKKSPNLYGFNSLYLPGGGS